MKRQYSQAQEQINLLDAEKTGNSFKDYFGSSEVFSIDLKMQK